jgi:hypothetical protein
MLKSRIHHGLALASAATLLSLSCGALAGAAAADPKPDHTDHGKHLGQTKDPVKGPKPGHQNQGHQNNGHANGHANGHQGQGHAYGHDHAPGQQGQGHGQGHGPSHPTGQPNGDGTGHNPPGNNGTVKIFGPGDAVGTPSNNPHPGCTFGVEWFGFDEGQDVVSTVTFAAQAPTSDVSIGGVSPSQVFVGGDPAGGGTDLDGRQTYSLTFSGGAPHPKQGYHVKLTVATPYSLGNDTKTKVFWVEPCAAEEDTTTSSSTASGAAASGGDKGDRGVEAETATAPDTAEQASGVEAETATAGAAVPTSVDAGEDSSTLADWARSPWPLVAVAGGLTLAGVAIARRKSRA